MINIINEFLGENYRHPTQFMQRMTEFIKENYGCYKAAVKNSAEWVELFEVRKNS